MFGDIFENTMKLFDEMCDNCGIDRIGSDTGTEFVMGCDMTEEWIDAEIKRMYGEEV